jgi:hypothetical protein
MSEINISKQASCGCAAWRGVARRGTARGISDSGLLRQTNFGDRLCEYVTRAGKRKHHQLGNAVGPIDNKPIDIPD